MSRIVDCESKQERRFFQRLDQLKAVTYFQEQVGRFPFKDGGRTRNYHPDALVALMDGRSFFVEIKSNVDLIRFSTLRKLEAMLRACEASGYGAFVGNDRRSLRQIASHRPRQALIRAFDTALKSGPIKRDRLDFIKKNMRAGILETDAAILKLRLVVENPLVVRRAESHELVILNSILHWLVPDSIESPKAPTQQGDTKYTEKKVAAWKTNSATSMSIAPRLSARSASSRVTP